MKIIKNIADIPITNSYAEEFKNYILFLKNGQKYRPEYKQYSSQIVSRYAYLQHLAAKSQYHYLVIGQDNHFSKTINFEEYISLYPFILGTYWNNIKHLDADMVLNRLKIPYNKNEPLQIGGIFITDLASRWDAQLQIITDLLTTEDGTIGKQHVHQKNHIPIYLCMPENDVIDQDQLNMNDFKITLESTYRQLFNEELNNLNILIDQDILNWYQSQKDTQEEK
ncbi:hypothetical protein pb186bvf_010384 [Paramecium bursaria]